jgi:hypothetical protein
MTPEEIADIDPHEHLNFQEITFILGLLVKHPVDLTLPTEADSEKRFAETYRLFYELHKKYGEPFIEEIARVMKDGLGNETPQENYRRVFGAGPVMTEPIFYSASGAYDFQYLEFAVDKYRRDAAWISQHIGIDIDEMATIARALKVLHECKFNDLPSTRPKNFSDSCTAALSVFCFEDDDLQRFGSCTSAAFRAAFTLKPGHVNTGFELPGQFNQLQSKPIVRLPDGRNFLPLSFILAEAIYEAPFYWMNSDLSYAGAALRNRGEFAEEVTAKLLASVFGEKNVYRNVQVREKKGHTVTDIDVLGVAGNKAVIAQVKSKRLTEPAKQGDEKKLVTDFKAAVQEAYDQGLRSKTALIDGKNQLFVADERLHLDESLDDAYILCVTVDNYPAVTHQTDVYLTKAPIEPFPIAINIFDLDILAFYLQDPFEFAYYLRQRITLNDYFKADSEMTLLGYHLKRKLFRDSKGDLELLDGSYAQLIDANFQVMRGSVPHTSTTERLRSQWRNDEFEALVKQVKLAPEPRFVDAVFLLYDLAGEGADRLIDLLKVAKQKAIADHRRHDCRLLLRGESIGITILCEPESRSTLRRTLLPLAHLAKYKSKADVWLALGCLSTSPNLVDTVAFAKFKWEKDAEMEKLASHLRGELMTYDGVKIGRNKLCLCGSGKKFKRCHGA